MSRQSEQDAGPGQFRPVAVPSTRRTLLFALEVVLCGRWGTPCTAERMVRDFQVHILSQPESVLAGARNCACLVVPHLDTHVGLRVSPRSIRDKTINIAAFHRPRFDAARDPLGRSCCDDWLVNRQRGANRPCATVP